MTENTVRQLEIDADRESRMTAPTESQLESGRAIQTPAGDHSGPLPSRESATFSKSVGRSRLP